MARWQVQLTGHAFDLEELPRLFTAPDLRVLGEGGQYLLEAQQFEPLGEAAAVHAAARDLLRLINGVAKLKDPSFQDVDVGSVRELDETGETRQHVVLLPATVEVRSKVSAVLVKVGEEEPEAPTPGALDSDERMRAALGDLHARRALALWGGRHDPMNLWKVWEIILQRSGLEIDEDQVRRRPANCRRGGPP